MNRLKRTGRFFNSARTPRMLLGVYLSFLRKFLARFDRYNIFWLNNSATPPRKVGKKIANPEQLQISFPHQTLISPCFRHQLRHLVDPDLRTVMPMQVWRNSKWCQQCRWKIKKTCWKGHTEDHRKTKYHRFLKIRSCVLLTSNAMIDYFCVITL